MLKISPVRWFTTVPCLGSPLSGGLLLYPAWDLLCQMIYYSTLLWISPVRWLPTLPCLGSPLSGGLLLYPAWDLPCQIIYYSTLLWISRHKLLNQLHSFESNGDLFLWTANSISIGEKGIEFVQVLLSITIRPPFFYGNVLHLNKEQQRNYNASTHVLYTIGFSYHMKAIYCSDKQLISILKLKTDLKVL